MTTWEDAPKDMQEFVMNELYQRVRFYSREARAAKDDGLLHLQDRMMKAFQATRTAISTLGYPQVYCWELPAQDSTELPKWSDVNDLSRDVLYHDMESVWDELQGQSDKAVRRGRSLTAVRLRDVSEVLKNAIRHLQAHEG